MFMTIAVTLCHLTFGTSDCFEEIVTNSNMTEGLTMQGCMTGNQAPIAQWKMQHPIYRSSEYTVSRIKCIPGRYSPAGRA